MKFLGIDLGWTTGASGLCCFTWGNDGIEQVELGHLVELDDLFAWIEARLSPNEPAVVAVDAPTLIPNETGMRVCDRLAHRYFGRYHAGCYPANLNRPFAQRTLEVGLRLERLGFQHQPQHQQPQMPGRYQLEVFPHAAMIHLFQLSRILKYKKGRLAERRRELVRLRELIVAMIPQLVPGFAPHIDLRQLAPDIPHKGTSMKAVEDQLDSFICAYVAAHWWYWGVGTQPSQKLSKNWVLGDRTTGYIVVPTPFGRMGFHRENEVGG